MAARDEESQLFLNELQEYLESLTTLVLDFEKDGSNTPLTEEVVRIVHSIKGMTAAMADQSLADISHWLESLLNAGIERRRVSPKLIGPLCVYIDKLQELLRRSKNASALRK
ncbi:MAG: Hpt domain-containing protein [Candidatus Heimdallarchaeota archaeon]